MALNVSYLMLLISLIVTMYTDPGRVPYTWGYFLDKNETKKRMHCLIKVLLFELR